MTASFRKELKKGVVGPFDMEAQVGSISAPFDNGTQSPVPLYVGSVEGQSEQWVGWMYL